MIGTTEFEYCKEKAMGDYCRLVMDISNNYWRNYWGNIEGIIALLYYRKALGINDNIKLHSSLGEMVGYFGNLNT